MVGQIVLVDVTPHVAIAPLRERIELPEPARLVPFHRLGARPRGCLLAPDSGYPGLGVREGALERSHLSCAAAVARAPRRAIRRRGVHDLHAQPVAVLDLAPDLVCLGEQHAGVDREHPCRRLDTHQHVNEDRLLLLEGAGHDERRMVALHRRAERLLRGLDCYTAHSPSPLMTSNGSFFCQSMKKFMFWRLNSTGIDRSRTSSSKRLWPTRSANSLKTSQSRRSASYIRT